jgi:FxsC-like protein
LPNPLPEAALVVQHSHRDFGEIYAREGLRRLMDLSRLRDHYKDFVGKFAKKLVQATREHSLPPDPQVRPIREIKNAFHVRGSAVKNPETGSSKLGPGIVKFIFVAGRRDELRAVRNRIEPYGEKGGRDWQPYLPDIADEVGIIAQRITTEEQFHYEPMDISENVIKRIEEAERQNNIVAIVVDTWSLRLPQYKNSMREYDDRKFLNCVVFVSWNNRDDETEGERSTLTHDMTETFYHNFIQPDPNCFLEINSHDELKKELPIALHKALQRIAQKAKVVKRADGARCITKPVITGVRAKGMSA